MAETILITGANRGIGLALTKLSLIKNLNIEACFRDNKNSEELQELSLEHPNLNIHEMDVTNSESIKKISQNINFKVDILVENLEILKNFVERGAPALRVIRAGTRLTVHRSLPSPERELG